MTSTDRKQIDKRDVQSSPLQRHEWLRQVADDFDVRPSAFKLAYFIREYVNRATGVAWPTQETLANKMDLSIRQVRDLTADLVKREHLFVSPGHGPKSSNRYRLQYRKETSAIDEAIPEAGFPLDNDPTGTALPHSVAKRKKTSAFEHAQPEVQRTKRGSTLPTEPIEEPNKNYIALETFEEWWAAYPLKKAKLRAQVAYRQVISKRLATPEELLSGAKRYADEQRGKDPKFIKHPATWLHSGCWGDEPEVRTGSTGRPDCDSTTTWDGVRMVPKMGPA